MATKGKKSKSKGSKAVSFNPDALVQAGLPDDFDGEITKARFRPWDYNGNLDHYQLAVCLEITPDPDSDVEVFEQYYSAGDLDHFAPSEDGETPHDLEEWDQEDVADVEGPFAVRVGKREAMANNTNWAHFVLAAVQAGFPAEDIGADLTVFEGVRAHFNRLPQKKRSGLVSGTESDRTPTILLITELLEEEAASKSKSKGTKGKGKGKVSKGKAKDEDEEEEEEEDVEEEESDDDEEGEEDSLDNTLAEILVAALGKEKDNTLPKRKILSTVVKNIDKSLKGAGVRRSSQAEFLESRDEWVYDEEDGSITLSE